MHGDTQPPRADPPPSTIIIKVWDRIKQLGVVAVLANLLITLMVIAYILLRPRNSDNVCYSENCVNTASRMILAMDQTVDPCQDFYEYACGGWISRNPVPDHATGLDRLGYLREKLYNDLRQLLERDNDFINGNSTPASVHKARMLYRTCMDTAALESKGERPIHEILKSLGLHENPPTNTSNKGFDWLYTIAKAKRLIGSNIFVSTYVSEDVRNTTINKLTISQVSPGFKDGYLLQPEKFSKEIKSHKEYIRSMLKAYSNFSDSAKFADDVVNFMIEIAKVMTRSKARRGPSHLFFDVSLVNLAQGPSTNDSTAWKYFDWNRYLNILFNDTTVVLEPKTDMAIITDLDYLKRLSALLKATNNVIIEKFVWWHVFSAVSPLTKAEFRSLGFKFTQQLWGLQEKVPRWKTCTISVNDNFGMALGYMFVHTRFKEEDRHKVLTMLEDIRTAFEKGVRNLNWMDTVTREKTITKVHAIRSFVGYPKWILNSTKLDEFYSKVKVINGDLFATFLALTNLAVQRNLERLRQQPIRDRWNALPTTVNAFYSATLNAVTIPAGILQPPFFGNAFEAVDFGSIGAIMGHEITHGFDDQGRKYDENGNLKQWWTNSTLVEYNERVKCIIDQYSSYSIPELGEQFPVDGYNTQGENIADNGGLRAAFEGYKQRAEVTSERHRRLPGLIDVTADQLFFLGFAQIWCGNSTMKAFKHKIFNEVHSPNRIRVIGTLANSEEFSQAWKCPLGTPMNPHKKCAVW